MVVVPLLLALAVSPVTSALLGGVAARRARLIEAADSENRAHDLRAAMRRLSSAARGCGFVSAVVAFGVTDAYATAYFGWTGVSARVIAAVVAVACFALPVAAARRPLEAAYERTRDIPKGAMRSHRMIAAKMIMVAAWALPLVAAVTAPIGLEGRSLLVVIAGMVAGPVLQGIAAPLIARVAAPAGLPGETQATLTALAARAGARAAS